MLSLGSVANVEINKMSQGFFFPPYLIQIKNKTSLKTLWAAHTSRVSSV